MKTYALGGIEQRGLAQLVSKPGAVVAVGINHLR